MKKICNIRTEPVFYKGPGTRINMKNLFTEPQVNLLQKISYVLREHPKTPNIIELFVDEETVTESHWTLIRLLFNENYKRFKS